MNVKEIEVDKIDVIENSRVKVDKIALNELMQSIKSDGLKQAIGVAVGNEGRYILRFGFSRLEAFKKLGYKKIYADVKENVSINDLRFENLIENIQRKDITPSEMGRICHGFQEDGMTGQEIATRLGIPTSKVNTAIDIYKQLPEKFRKKVSYFGSGMTNKNGKVSASVTQKIITAKRAYGLSDNAIEKIFETARTHDFNMKDIEILSAFLERGASTTQAIAALKQFSHYKVDITVDNEDIEKLLEKYKIDSVQQLLQQIVYGFIPGIKKPDFVKIVQPVAK